MCPNSAISAGAMTAVAFTMVTVLATLARRGLLRRTRASAPGAADLMASADLR
jgi:hypothetical protein